MKIRVAVAKHTERGDENPNRAPDELAREEHVSHDYVGRASGGRFLAANIDHSLAVVLFLGVGMSAGESIGDIPAGIAALASYLGYYFLPEWLFGTTLGKSIFALRVRQVSGQRCTAAQIVVRTLMRFIEVNPFLLGGLPAGISILVTEKKQRLGDLIAGTLVVHRNDIADALPAVQR